MPSANYHRLMRYVAASCRPRLPPPIIRPEASSAEAALPYRRTGSEPGLDRAALTTAHLPRRNSEMAARNWQAPKVGKTDTRRISAMLRFASFCFSPATPDFERSTRRIFFCLCGAVWCRCRRLEHDSDRTREEQADAGSGLKLQSLDEHAGGRL